MFCHRLRGFPLALPLPPAQIVNFLPDPALRDSLSALVRALTPGATRRGGA